MRLFPGAGRQPAVPARSHRTVAVLTALVLTAGLAGPAAYADRHHHGAGQLRHRAQHVHGQIGRVSGDLDDVSAQVRRITGRLQRARGRLATARTSLRQVQRQLRSAQRTETRLQGRLTAAQARLDAAVAQVHAAQTRVEGQRQTTRETVIGFATQGDPRLALLTSYLQDGDLGEVMMSQTGNDVAVGSETSTLTDLQDAEDALQAKQQQVQTVRNQVRAHRSAAQRTVVRVRGLRNQAVTRKRRVRTLVATTKRARLAAVRARRADMGRLRRLRAEEARIKRRILAATAADGNRHVGDTHGMFLSPVRNTYITSPYGWRRHPIYHYWGLHDGDDFHAPCGVPEIAVGPGRVIEEYYSQVWGHRLYLDLGRVNGHGFVAIYNHISRYRVRVGAHVAAGGTVAYAGTTGWSTACHLHFTLMRDGNPVNPAPYLGF